MDWETLEINIQKRFKEQLMDSQIALDPVEWPNASKAFTKPDVNDKDSIWARVQIFQNQRRPMSFGGATNRYRVNGFMLVQLFVPLDTGTKAILAMAENVKDNFQSATEDSINWETPELVEVGRSGEWYQRNVRCPFYADGFS